MAVEGVEVHVRRDRMMFKVKMTESFKNVRRTCVSASI